MLMAYTKEFSHRFFFLFCDDYIITMVFHHSYRSFDELEAEMLHGQKLQGVSTAKEVYEVLTYRGWQELFPLLSTVHEICIGQLPPTSIVEYSEHTPNLSIINGSNAYY
jgi:glycerol-3-phosphate dehydrogenase (NAD+)